LPIQPPRPAPRRPAGPGRAARRRARGPPARHARRGARRPPPLRPPAAAGHRRRPAGDAARGPARPDRPQPRPQRTRRRTRPHRARPRRQPPSGPAGRPASGPLRTGGPARARRGRRADRAGGHGTGGAAVTGPAPAGGAPVSLRERAAPADRVEPLGGDAPRYLRHQRLPPLGETRQRRLGCSRAGGGGARLRLRNPGVLVWAVVGALGPATGLVELAGRVFVLDGTDNSPTCYLASDACEMLDIPLVWGSILAFSGQVSVSWGAGGRGVTYRDVHPVPPRPGEVPGCSEAGVLGMRCGEIGASIALDAAEVLAGMGEVLFGRLALYDALSARWEHLPIARDPARPAVTRLEDLTLTCGLPGPIGPGGAEVSA